MGPGELRVFLSPPLLRELLFKVVSSMREGGSNPEQSGKKVARLLISKLIPLDHDVILYISAA